MKKKPPLHYNRMSNTGYKRPSEMTAAQRIEGKAKPVPKFKQSWVSETFS